MNRYIKFSLFYTIFGLASGLFYREFAKMNGVDGSTSLALIHVHTLMLGMAFFLILAILESKLQMSTFKSFKYFMITYNAGLLITIGIFLTRGITETLGTNVSNSLDKALSGIGGMGHILLSVGLIIMLLILNKSSKMKDLTPSTNKIA